MNLEKDMSPTGLYNYLPKLGRKTRKNKIGPLKKGLLKKVGYSTTARATRRHAAIKRAVKKYGRASTIRKLNAVSVLTRRRSPESSKTFKSDMKFAQTLKGGDRTDKLEKLKGTVSLVLSKRDASAPAGKELLGRAKKLGVTVPKPKSLDALYGALKDALSPNKK